MGKSIITQINQLNKSTKGMCDTIIKTSGEISSLRSDFKDYQAGIGTLVRKQVFEQMTSSADIVATVARKQASISHQHSIYTSNLCIRMMLAMIVNVGFATNSNFSTFFNFMFDNNEQDNEVYLVIHVGLLAWLKVMEPLFGNYELPSNYMHLLKSSLVLLEPELDKSMTFYRAARKLFPCHPFKSYSQDAKKVQVFKLSKMMPYLKLAQEDEHSPFLPNASSCHKALSLSNTISMKSSASEKKGGGKLFKAVVSVHNRQVTNFRQMVPVSNPKILSSYMVENKSGSYYKYLSRAKHVGVSAGTNFFTEATMTGINIMRSLHGKHELKRPKHVSFGWNVCNDEICDFKENVWNLDSTLPTQDNAHAREEEESPVCKKRKSGSRKSPRLSKKVRYY